MSPEERARVLSWTNWDVDPSLLAGAVVVCLAYALAARRADATGEGPTQRQRWLFAGAVASLFVALASPLHELSEKYLFTAHMAQHLVLMLAVPPLLLASLSPAMLRPLLRPAWALVAARFLTRPPIAYAAANVVFLVWHIPHLYDAALRTHALHVFSHWSYLITATMLWWPLLSPTPALPRLPHAGRLLYIFLQVLPGMLVGGLVANAPRALYGVYADAPRIVGLTAREDQQVGAILMWVGGGAFWLIAFTVVFFAMAARDMAESRAAQPQHDPRVLR